MHIVANRVDNDGNTISDRNDAIRNVAVCKALTREYGLHFSRGKVNVKRDRLRGKDKVKYQIHDAVKAALPHCNSWSELCDRLAKQGIEVNFKLDRRNGNIIGVSFTKDGISFSGSRIDRSMGFLSWTSSSEAVSPRAWNGETICTIPDQRLKAEQAKRKPYMNRTIHLNRRIRPILPMAMQKHPAAELSPMPIRTQA